MLYPAFAKVSSCSRKCFISLNWVSCAWLLGHALAGSLPLAWARSTICLGQPLARSFTLTWARLGSLGNLFGTASPLLTHARLDSLGLARTSFLDQEFFRTKNLFGKLFFIPIVFYSSFVGTIIYFKPNYFWTKFFSNLKFFSRPKF